MVEPQSNSWVCPWVGCIIRNMWASQKHGRKLPELNSSVPGTRQRARQCYNGYHGPRLRLPLRPADTNICRDRRPATTSPFLSIQLSHQWPLSLLRVSIGPEGYRVSILRPASQANGSGTIFLDLEDIVKMYNQTNPHN